MNRSHLAYRMKKHGDTYSVYECGVLHETALLHNLAEWQAMAIVAILNAGVI